MSTEERLERYATAIESWAGKDARTSSAHRAIAVADAEQAELRAELDRVRRGAEQLGKTLDAELRDIVEATDSHDLIGEDGDGDWALVNERLLGLRPRALAAEAALDRVRALADFWEGTCDPQFPPSNVMEALFAVDQIRLVLAGGIPGPGGVRFAAADAEDGGQR